VTDDGGRELVSIDDFVLRRLDVGTVGDVVHAAAGATRSGGAGIRPADGAEALAEAPALGRPDPVDRPQRIAGSDYVPPRNEVEATLAALWAEVLGVDRVGVQDDFFDLGGNSLVAVQLIAQVRKELGVKLPMQTLFEGATVARMAAGVARLRVESTGLVGSKSGHQSGLPAGSASAGEPAGPTAGPSGAPPAPTIRRLPRNM